MTTEGAVAVATEAEDRSPGWGEPAPFGGTLLGIPAAEYTPRVRRAVSALISEARALRDELRRAREQLVCAEQLADRDHLLPVLNRRAFLRELAREIASSTRYGTPSSFIFLDLDGLKQINDSYGHACGDAVLMHFATLLRSHARESDAVGRLGGDEFGLILTHAPEDAAVKKCEQLAELLAAAPLSWNGLPLPYRFSGGTAALTAGITGESALACADTAMYRRKRLTR
jgi:diguanylate cyclase (GGDEF)-like protein